MSPPRELTFFIPEFKYSGRSFHENSDFGWKEIKDAGFVPHNGGKYHNWFIVRKDIAHLRVKEIKKYGKLNVHYFNTTEHACCWYNSYMLRWIVYILQYTYQYILLLLVML